MSKLDDIIRERMKYIVYKENRPFSFLDFTDFDLKVLLEIKYVMYLKMK